VVSPEALRTPASKLSMPIADDLTHHVPLLGVLSRQRTANKQPEGPTTASGDRASDLLLRGSGGRI
jgi:hypothetical protein